jgi:hypothetical protein
MGRNKGNAIGILLGQIIIGFLSIDAAGNGIEVEKLVLESIVLEFITISDIVFKL